MNHWNGRDGARIDNLIMSSASRALVFPRKRREYAFFFFSLWTRRSRAKGEDRFETKGRDTIFGWKSVVGYAYRTFLFCPLCLASFLSLLIAQLILSKRLDQEGKCLALVFFFRILNTPREFFDGSRRKLINMLRSVQNIHAETACDGLSQLHWLSYVL